MVFGLTPGVAAARYIDTDKPKSYLLLEVIYHLTFSAMNSCEGGALPVIMSITGPRETHDYPLGRTGYNPIKIIIPKQSEPSLYPARPIFTRPASGSLALVQ